MLYPPIDDLLKKVNVHKETTLGSKFALASYAADRAKQIVQYNVGIEAGQLDSVAPLVDYYEDEKPLSIALREIEQDKLNLITDAPQ
ncbi:MAG: DNA-directed RNA polymerase subunit omega [Candidatus Ancillula sp.]|nr:DNA-directed RNA polymerase subunit omega [Candidatus Ancillula sp.]